MKVLVACEYSGAVREALRKKGHDAYSCDIIPSDDNSAFHIQDKLENVLTIEQTKPFDMIIAFPPCTHLCVSGARWFKDKVEEQKDALEFVQMIMDAPCKKIAIENPIGVISTKIRKPDQIVQPWQFGHGETKATCLWLKGLPKLEPTNIVEGREARIHNMPPGKDRGKMRSKTYQGIADAMADQWG